MPRFWLCFDSRATSPPLQVVGPKQASTASAGQAAELAKGDLVTTVDTFHSESGAPPKFAQPHAAFGFSAGESTAPPAAAKQGWLGGESQGNAHTDDVTTTQITSFGIDGETENVISASVAGIGESVTRPPWRQADAGDGLTVGPPQLDVLLNGTRKGSYSMFTRFDTDNDGLITKEDLSRSMTELGLALSHEMYRQFIECNFVYADRDRDGYLSFDEFHTLYKLICEIRKKFKRYDLDLDGQINKADFESIVKELNLNLDAALLKQYVDINFRYADRNLRGLITFGQFLACYANFLYTYEVTHNRTRHSKPQTTGGDVLVEEI